VLSFLQITIKGGNRLSDIDLLLSQDFLANSVFFQLQLLAYNLVEVFNYAHLDLSQLRLTLAITLFLFVPIR